MASRRGANEFSSSSSSPIDEDDAKDSKIPDVSSMDQSRDNNSRITEESTVSTVVKAGGDLPRREENPFSFKHFLSKDARTNYNSAGARPKIYSSVRKTPEKLPNAVPETDNLYSRNPTELPDFVQDHLVIEQCYMNHDTASTIPCNDFADLAAGAGAVDPPLLVDMDNFPDFTMTSLEQNETPKFTEWRSGNDKSEGSSGDLPFDLTGGLLTSSRKKRGKHSTIGISNDNETRTGPTNSPANEASVNKLLPDFLNDGPIRNRVAAAPSNPESTSSLDNFAAERLDQSLLLENERLREELQDARRQIAGRTRMIESLKAELNSRRQVDHEETAHLEKAMEQVEANLRQSTQRATSAENAVTLLKQQVKALTAEVAMLRTENQQLSGSTGAGCTADYRTPATERRIKKLSDELRSAATSAEVSLRQLMSGVSNLKVLASALENVDRIEDRTKDFLPDFEEENAAGPAL